LIQNTDGADGEVSAIDVTRNLWESGGPGAFYDGITPKVLRAGVSTSINFYVYDLMVDAMTKHQ